MSSSNQKHKFADLEPLCDLYPFENSRVGEDFGLVVDKKDIKKSVRVCLIYYFHWLKGLGAVAFDNQMEVSSTVDICRIHLWVWLHQRVRVTDGKAETVRLDTELVHQIIEKEAVQISTHDKLTLIQAKTLLRNLLKQPNINESFLELAYSLLDKHQAKL
jgi:malate synthase